MKELFHKLIRKIKSRFPVSSRSFYEQQRQILTQLQQMQNDLHALEQRNESDIGGFANEMIAAHSFHDTTKDSPWLKNQSFSPTGGAATYLLLYVLYRSLDIFHPKKILELGLGQTTKLIIQYASANEDVLHYAVDGDESWVKYIENTKLCSARTKLIYNPVGVANYKDESVSVFENLKKHLNQERFDYILIDAPAPTCTDKDFRRLDLLFLLPEILAESFFIFSDDLHTEPIRNSWYEIDRKLTELHIAHISTIIHGVKDIGLICSANYASAKNIILLPAFNKMER